MPYRTAIPRPGEVHTLRFRPALAFVVPLATLLVALRVSLAVTDYPSLASVVSCSGKSCTTFRPVPRGEWKEIPCEQADGEMVALTAPTPLVWHRIYTWDFMRTHEYVSASAARAHLARCVEGSQDIGVAYVVDVGLARSALALGCGLLASLVFYGWARTRGLHVEIDEPRRQLRCTHRGWLTEPRSVSCGLQEIESVVLLHDRNALPGEHRLACVLSSGDHLVLARTRSRFERRRFARAAALITARIDEA